MKGYVFVLGVDGFGADVAPAYEEGCYLDYDKAFRHLCKLNARRLKDSDQVFYEEGYGEDHYPANDTTLKQAEDEEDWTRYAEELNKHIITDIVEICKRIINDYEEPPMGMYSMMEIEIRK